MALGEACESLVLLSSKSDKAALEIIACILDESGICTVPLSWGRALAFGFAGSCKDGDGGDLTPLWELSKTSTSDKVLGRIGSHFDGFNYLLPTE